MVRGTKETKERGMNIKSGYTRIAETMQTNTLVMVNTATTVGL